MRVLIVEDAPLNAQFMAAALRAEGHAVLGPFAASGEALAAAEETPPDVAVIDLHLRDGASGIALARLLRARWNVPSILVSGDDPTTESALAGVSHLTKPYSADALILAVRLAPTLARRADQAGAPAPPDPD